MSQEPGGREWIKFKHARFTARFPADFSYSRSHYWMAKVPGETDLWRVGFTKFATRMLGELVDFEFQPGPGDAIAPGQMIGWAEGFKAASDIFCVMQGKFAGANPALEADACIVKGDPYFEGWLYSAHGSPEQEALTAQQYHDFLQETITRMQQAEHQADGD